MGQARKAAIPQRVEYKAEGAGTRFAKARKR